MPTVKRIVCLANSRKLTGRCIAGKVISDDEYGIWVRPVSDREHEEVSEHERQYIDGSDPRILDIIDVPVTEPRAHAHQQENWLIDTGHYWKKTGSYSVKNLDHLTDTEEILWVNGYSTYNGKNDKVPVAIAEKQTSSLKLIHVEKADLCVFPPGESFGNNRRKVQCRFQYCGNEYRLRVTDPIIERGYLAQNDGT